MVLIILMIRIIRTALEEPRSANFAKSPRNSYKMITDQIR